MPFQTPDRNAVRDKMLRDLVSQRPGADVSPDSDYYVRASAHAAAAEGLYAHQAWIARQIFPDDCDDDELLRFADWYGLTRKPASAATGTATLSGTAGTVIAAGTELRSASGVAFATSSAASVGSGGAVVVDVHASAAGATGNLAAGSALTVSSPPAGVLAAAVAGAITGGADIETVDALRVRVLAIRRNPPAGGARHDYLRWALEVAGVAAVYVHPLRRGDGTVDVSIMAVGGLPSVELVATVQDYINAVRPVTADCVVLAPTPVNVGIAGALVVMPGYVRSAVLSSVQLALAEYFATLSPGDTVYLTRVIGIISAVPGVQDFNLTAPASTVVTVVTPTAVELAMLGAVAFT